MYTDVLNDLHTPCFHDLKNPIHVCIFYQFCNSYDIIYNVAYEKSM